MLLVHEASCVTEIIGFLLILTQLHLVSAQHSARDCEDNHDNCPLWAQHGGCESNPGYMRKNCKQSCHVGCEKPPPVIVASNGGAQSNSIGALIKNKHRQKQIRNRVTNTCPVGCVSLTCLGLQDSSDVKCALDDQELIAPPSILTENVKPCHVVSAQIKCCKDVFLECPKLAGQGHCDDNNEFQTWMLANCEWSCGQCIGHTVLSAFERQTIRETCLTNSCKEPQPHAEAMRDRLLMYMQDVGYTQFEARQALALTLTANKQLLKRDGLDDLIEPYDDGTYAGVLLTEMQAELVIDYVQGKMKLDKPRPPAPSAPSIVTLPTIDNQDDDNDDVNGTETLSTGSTKKPAVEIPDFGVLRQARNRRRVGDGEFIQVWKDQPIKYFMNESMEEPQKKLIRKAFSEIEKSVAPRIRGQKREGCLKFEEVDARNKLKDSSCAVSNLGKVERNIIVFNFNCVKHRPGIMPGVIVGAIVQTLGIGSEHQRRDRHQHLQLLHHQIDHQAYSVYAQNPYPLTAYGLPYDMESIAHPSTQLARWADLTEIGCGHTMQVVEKSSRAERYIRNKRQTHKLQQHTQDSLSLNDVHRLTRLYCVGDGCPHEETKCGYFVTEDPTLCKSNQMVLAECPRTCGDVGRGCHV